jgi:hypothetical protein
MRIPLVRFDGDDTPWAWWEYLFFPLMVMLLFIVGPALVIVSVPYCWLYPERLPNEWDRDGNAAHARAMKRWRAAYARLTFAGRVRRSWIKRRRRRRRAG